VSIVRVLYLPEQARKMIRTRRFSTEHFINVLFRRVTMGHRSMTFVEAYRRQVLEAISSIDLDRVEQAIHWFREAREQGRMIFVAGNGGSAATASHLVCDLVKDVSFGRDLRFRAMALQDAIPTATAYANDVGFSEGIVETLRNFAQAGDLYMALSGSGNSPNLVKGLEWANAHGLRTLALTGRDGGKLGAAAQLNIQVSVPHMGRIQDAHHVICHMLSYAFSETP
jgi:D-sedoheptulose 7-phosphate isomerase